MILNNKLKKIDHISKCKKVKKTWGNEVVIENNDKYCCKFLNIKRRHKSSIHYHKIKDETFFVLKGKIILIHDKDIQVMSIGQYKRILPYEKHSFIGLEDSQILEVSTHHLDSDSFRISLSKKLNQNEFDNIVKRFK